ncbi:polyprenol phosphomannose-dependent alpha 1,6 mannosyltransferase MptB [Streptomyces sp. Je 1-79]|uniref:polyprenol phosphomannose-dependent alpha 1,6 mannosyltransferase MptB n=1 Tax=Streptomyces sp. Je 1-79 TaxID=2943847 RepID=UPI0021A86246|nr:polyprenol phosphomannose-dependent alpha 1,6 mannosyltransferase MptB [Streptomyces sp. Je 1-79]MCT4355580.1 polyprenol phosphomannose-dependent alpha 1,6 mannosyltransferase MptB [Streptomyces sp. Je 1-79]
MGHQDDRTAEASGRRRPGSASGCRWLGAFGSLAVAVGGYGAGTLPVREPWGLWAPRGSATAVAGALLAYLGLTLLVVAWWRYGVLLARGVREARERVLGTLAWWTAPLVLAPPLYSADVYSYIAQGAMVLEGYDVYGAGPSVLGPGDLGADAAASVGGHWTDTPAPYGPVFLVLARAVVELTGGAIVPAVAGMRLIALGALALIVWAVRGLGGGSGALWLAALNPLLLIHVVGGMHNDGLMIGLMLSGVLLATRGRWVLGAVLVGLAMMIKSPAAVALLFVGVMVARRDGGVRGVAKGLVLPGLVAGAVAAGATVVAGTGFGWLRTQSVAGAIHTALSATSDVGLGLGLLLADDPDPVKGVVQKLGLLAAAVIILALAWRAWKGRIDPVPALGLSLVALVALSPMVQPWYLLWGVCAVAPAAWDTRRGQVLAVVSAALVYETAPSGRTPGYGFAVAAVVLVVGLWWVRRAAWASPRGGGTAEGDAAPAAVARQERVGQQRVGQEEARP